MLREIDRLFSRFLKLDLNAKSRNRRRAGKIAIALLFVAVVVGGVLFVSKNQAVNILFQNLFPPSDYFDPLGTLEVDLSISDSLYELEWTNKYMGSHSIVFAVEHPPHQPVDSEDWYKVGLEGDITILFNNQKNMFVEIEELHRAFWGGPGIRGGFRLLKFDTPDGLPLGVPLKCRLRVDHGKSEFFERYGETRLMVMKDSDL